MSTRAELEQQLVDNPEDRETLLVYADLLQAAGDPRGELITLHNTLAKEPGNKRVVQAASDLLQAHASRLLPGFADVVGEQDMLELTWELGFVRAARVKWTHDRWQAKGQKRFVPEVLRTLLDSESARLLRELTVGIVDFEGNNYTEVIAVLAERARPTLRKLFLGDFGYRETELNWSEIGDCSPAYAALANLRELTLRSGAMTLGKIVLPELRAFYTITGGFSEDCVASVASAVWPRLEQLQLQFGANHQGAYAELDHTLQPVLDGVGLPALTHLGLTNAAFTDALCAVLPRSKILPQLRSLDLSMGTMSDEGARHLADAAPALRHLHELAVDDNYLTDEGRRLLEGIGIPVGFGQQRDDDGNPSERYISAYE